MVAHYHITHHMNQSNHPDTLVRSYTVLCILLGIALLFSIGERSFVLAKYAQTADSTTQYAQQQATLEQRLNEATAETAHLRKEVSDYRSEQTDMRKEIGDARAELTDARHELTDARHELTDARAALNSQKAQ